MNCRGALAETHNEIFGFEVAKNESSGMNEFHMFQLMCEDLNSCPSAAAEYALFAPKHEHRLARETASAQTTDNIKIGS